VHLLRSVSFAQFHALPGVRTRLYEFSRKVAMMARDWCRRFPVSPEVSSYNGVVLVVAVNAHFPWVSRISGMLRVLIECGGRERCAGWCGRSLAEWMRRWNGLGRRGGFFVSQGSALPLSGFMCIRPGVCSRNGRSTDHLALVECSTEDRERGDDSTPTTQPTRT
jgi:hypothetical protein